ncbi:quinoprotein dehydrogenase-associated putative ABC transporter substrate-binding protein [Calidithermus timidus]|uniref:quinoprotein dehydrogenase-associated putative ABC transporter substrate-binding protein n=1 Tax=Calidithermus timidus TaxID=307124 RepID=UPI00035CB8D2|nr:quinoprotein dehydrogenase-associated putative ABC transporter substrate-binding protein [Calidithermus timidus]
MGKAQDWELRACADSNGLPYSNQQQQGFDNRIAEVLAQDLGARLSYEWWPQGASTVQLKLREGSCDVVMSVGEGYQGVLSTIPYYQSSFVLVYREDSPYQIETLDDEVLRQLRIAIETAGIPPFQALANRGLSEKAAILEAVDPDDRTRSPIVEAVARGEVDVAILWGPVAGYFARRQPVKLRVVPISPEFEPPALSMVYPVTIGVRAGDEALRDRLNLTIARRWEQIQGILEEYGVPQIPLPKPLAQTEEPAQASKTLRIGLVVPTQTGSTPVSSSIYEDTGEAARRGAVLAGDELNQQAEGVGMQLKVLVASAPNAEAAFRAAARLVATEGISALIGGVGQGQAEALSRLAEQRRVLFFNIGSPDDRLRQEACSRYTFHIEASAAMYLDALAAWFIQAGFRSWFLIYEEGPEGQTLYQRARKSLLERHFGAREAGRASVSPSRPDFRPALEAIRRAQPQVLLLLLGAETQLSFLGQYEAARLGAAVTGFPHPETQTRAFFAASRSRAKAGAGHRAVLWEAKLDAYGARELNARFRERFKKPMDPSAWASYQSVKLLFEAASFGGSLEGPKLVSYLENPRTVFDVHKGIGVSFRPWDHQLRQSLYLVKISPEAKDDWNLAGLVGELPAIYRPGTDPIERLDQLGDLRRDSRCRFEGGR